MCYSLAARFRLTNAARNQFHARSHMRRVFLHSRPEMLIETLDARIQRALARVREARAEGHPAVIADRERMLDRLLDQRLEMTCPIS